MSSDFHTGTVTHMYRHTHTHTQIHTVLMKNINVKENSIKPQRLNHYYSYYCCFSSNLFVAIEVPTENSAEQKDTYFPLFERHALLIEVSRTKVSFVLEVLQC